jgi:type I restriction enzyme M protein
VCLWFVSRDKKNLKFKDRKEKVLFIDARKMGTLVDRVHRELTEDDIKKISDTYHSWRNKNGKHKDVKGYCKSATLKEIQEQVYILTPGRYVGAEDIEEDDEVFDEKMKRLTAELSEQFAESKVLEKEIKKNLTGLGFEV